MFKKFQVVFESQVKMPYVYTSPPPKKKKLNALLRPWLLYGLNFFFRVSYYIIQKSIPKKKHSCHLINKPKQSQKSKHFFQPKITKDQINKLKSSYLTAKKSQATNPVVLFTLVSISQESTYDKLRREWVLT